MWTSSQAFWEVSRSVIWLPYNTQQSELPKPDQGGVAVPVTAKQLNEAFHLGFAACLRLFAE